MKHLLSTLLLVSFLGFFFLGKHPLSPWDEARTGVNAIEMLNNGDWANLHYAGQPDIWCAKPPFVVWCVATSFSIFGKNELALRLPSALAIIGAFFFIFKTITLFRSVKFAMWTCLLLASVDGLIGWHVSRTGDFDAMLVFFLMGGVYFFLRADLQSFKNLAGLIYSAIFFGFAFLTKGPASLVLFPGILLFLFFEKKLKAIIRHKGVWLAVAIFSSFPIAWGLVQYFYGIRYVQNTAGATAFERLFFYDIWVRFTQRSEGWKSAFSPDFFFYSLDKSFNVWNYVFFLWLIFGFIYWIKNRSQTISFFKRKKNRLLLFSLCVYFPLALFLTLAAKSNTWYLAPALPFVGIATFWGIDIFCKKYKEVKFIFFGLLLFTLGRQVWDFSKPKNKPSFIVENAEKIKTASMVYQSGQIEQDVLLYLYFLNDNLIFKEPMKLDKRAVFIKSKDGQYTTEK